MKLGLWGSAPFCWLCYYYDLLCCIVMDLPFVINKCDMLICILSFWCDVYSCSISIRSWQLCLRCLIIQILWCGRWLFLWLLECLTIRSCLFFLKLFTSYILIVELSYYLSILSFFVHLLRKVQWKILLILSLRSWFMRLKMRLQRYEFFLSSLFRYFFLECDWIILTSY